MKVKLDVVLKKRPALPQQQQQLKPAAAAAIVNTDTRAQGARPKIQTLPSIQASLNAAWVTPPASPSISLHRIAPLPPVDILPKQQSTPKTLPKTPGFGSLNQRTQSLWNLPSQKYCPPPSPILKKKYELVRMRSLTRSRKSLRPDSQLENILESEKKKAFCSSKASLV